VTREHEDSEITVFRHHQQAVRTHFAGRGLYKAVEGWVPWEEDEWLDLPVHQVLVRPAGGGPPDEPWEPGPGEVQLFLNEVENGVWRCRRDPERITRPAGDVLLASAAGIPIVAPEIQLLYKAKWHRDKDEHDFERARDVLSTSQSGWLRDALGIVHPDDPWLQAL
jgi:hypothetical protein